MAERYDEYLKEMVRLSPREWVSFVFADHPTHTWEVKVEKKELSYVTKRLDYLIRIHTPGGEEFLLHFEFAFQPTPDLPFRIHTYRAITEEQEGVPVYTVTFFLQDTPQAQRFPERVQRQVLGRTVEEFCITKEVVGSWDAEEMVESPHSFVWALLPLMEVHPERAAEVFRKGLEKILALEDSKKRDLFLVVFYTFGGYRYPEIIEQVMEEHFMKELMESVTYRRILERGAQQGARRKAQEAILNILKARFGSVDEEIRSRVQSIEDLSRLDELIVAAAKCTSLSEFYETLKKHAE